MLFFTRKFYMAEAITTLKNSGKINILQKKCLRIMNFKPYNDHTNSLFASNKIIKLYDVIKIEKINLAFQFKLDLLPNGLKSLFHPTGILVPSIKTLSYGERSIKYAIPSAWNEFIKTTDYRQFKTPKSLRFLKDILFEHLH